MTIEQYILEKRRIINTELDRILPKEHIIDEAVRYTVLATSNRWRPIVTIATSEMYGVKEKEILPIASAIEMLNGASIMIDDLPSFDNATLRRGKQTLHKVYGEALGILASFYTVHHLAFSLISGSDLPEPIRKRLIFDFPKLINEMVLGQAKDVLSKGKTMTTEEILQMYGQKSGALYGFSAVAGGVVGRASDSEIEALRKYGRSMGTAYQVLDDILDIEAKPKEIGKDVQQDLCKPTLPSLIGVEASKRKAQGLMQDAKQALTRIDRDTFILTELVDYIVLINKKLTAPVVRFGV